MTENLTTTTLQDRGFAAKRGRFGMVLVESVKTSSKNRLLAQLGAEDLQRLYAHLQPVALDYKKILYEAGQPFDFVYFPLSGVTSMLKTMEDGSSSEVGTTGNEGMVGLPLLFGEPTGGTSVHVEVPGEGLRMPARLFRDALARSPAMQALMRRFSYAVFNQVSQLVACNRLHDVEQRCARWLLMAHDRMPGDDFMLTHEVLSLMLGVRRSIVTVAAGRLSDAGLIEYRRGRVTILDRAGLQRRSCECYAAIQSEYDRAFAGG
jgi:CRP-like cAMP-binding protein